MLLRKKIAYQFKKLFARFPKLQFSWGKFGSVLLQLTVIIALVANIIATFTKGVETQTALADEQKRLEALEIENKTLLNEVEHFASIEYKKIYARDNLNLAEKNESLYYVDRPEYDMEIEGLPEKKIEITFKDNLAYWGKLLLGL